MSDKEFTSTDDLSLPKATVQKILTEILPPGDGLTTSKDFRDTLTDCCVDFITLIATEANEISEKDSKKTIACEHVTGALKELGFEDYVRPVLETAEEFKKQQASREKKQSKMEASGLSQDELLRQQQELFQAATNKFSSGPQDSADG
ncbi:MAG: hypothetical protein M1828_004381 [Chrysothrix sp. TS-e1954]|nr:MAG: hypothetical protein M1828_004381 [Chrysothrix sp. TS-e1954]